MTWPAPDPATVVMAVNGVSDTDAALMFVCADQLRHYPVEHRTNV